MEKVNWYNGIFLTIVGFILMSIGFVLMSDGFVLMSLLSLVGIIIFLVGLLIFKASQKPKFFHDLHKLIKFIMGTKRCKNCGREHNVDYGIYIDRKGYCDNCRSHTVKVEMEREEYPPRTWFGDNPFKGRFKYKP